MQTPQVFEYGLIKSAYEKLIQDRNRLADAGVNVTDDTMVAKMYGDVDAKLVENKECNIKITTPEDMVIAEALIKARETV